MAVYKTISIFIFLFFAATNLIGQETEVSTYSKFPIKIAIGNHAVGFPYQNSFARFNPTVFIGTEKSINSNQKHQWLISSNLGFITNKVIGNAIAIDFDIGYRYQSPSRFYLGSSLGLGIMNQYHPRNIYTLSASKTSYENSNDGGRTSSLIGLKTNLGYDFSKKNSLPINISIEHHFFIQTSYFNLNNFPIMPQTISSILITYKFKKS